MTFSPTDFEEKTEYERLVLDAAYPLIARRATGVTIDVTRRGHRGIKIGLPPLEDKCEFPPLGGGEIQEGDQPVTLDIRPLIFGAAWKVLDLLVEGVIGHSTGKGMQVKDKLAKLLSEPAPTPFSGETKLWERTVAIYSSTAEMRNCIVHRRFRVDDHAEVMRGQPRRLAIHRHGR